jgi:hypothetical protein
VANRLVSDLVAGTASGTANVLTANQSFVAAAYQDILGRSASAGELAAWTALLDDGTSFAVVASDLVHSAESYGDFVTAAYQSYVDRTPTTGEQAAWVSLMENGVTDEQVEAQILASPEYLQSHGGGGAGWVTNLYQTVLNRTPSQAEVNGWVQALAGGASAAQIAYALAASAEHEGQVITADYQKYLGRAPAATELAGWVNAYLAEASNETIIANLVGSAEYYTEHAGG